MEHVVYLTYYKGDKLPPWYIGTSSVSNVLNGYNGSVSSIKYKHIYKEEQKKNKELFVTRILSYHETRQEAMDEELRLQQKHSVINNPKYFNMAYAKPTGYIGLSLRGADHPQFGTTHPEDFCINISNRQSGTLNTFFGKSHSEESKSKMREKLSGNNNPFRGKSFNETALQKIKDKSGTSKDSAYVFSDKLELCRRASGEELEELLNSGWEKGRRVYERNKGVDKITIYHKELRKNRKIYPRELDYFIERDWKKGKYNFNRKTRANSPTSK